MSCHIPNPGRLSGKIQRYSDSSHVEPKRMKCNSTFKRRHENINKCHNFPFVKLLLSVFIFLHVRLAHLPGALQLPSENRDKAVSCSPVGVYTFSYLWVFIAVLLSQAHAEFISEPRAEHVTAVIEEQERVLPSEHPLIPLCCSVQPEWSGWWKCQDKQLTVIWGIKKEEINLRNCSVILGKYHSWWFTILRYPWVNEWRHSSICLSSNALSCQGSQGGLEAETEGDPEQVALQGQVAAYAGDVWLSLAQKQI